MAIPTRIYLTGFMGSGKSTIGPRLAARLGYEFIDLDKAVELVAGKPVQSIFADDGEGEFRRIESLKLRSVSRKAREVVALGGGALISEDNLYFVTTNGVLVYLRMQPEELANRIRQDGTARPLLMDDKGEFLSGDRLLERIRSMIAERERFYNQADIILDADRLTVDEAVDSVIASLEHYAHH